MSRSWCRHGYDTSETRCWDCDPASADEVHALLERLGSQDARVLEARTAVSSIYDLLPFATSEELDEIVRIARARAIRAVVAAQWATACIVWEWAEAERNDERNGHYRAEMIEEAIAALPTAEEVVDGGRSGA